MNFSNLGLEGVDEQRWTWSVQYLPERRVVLFGVTRYFPLIYILVWICVGDFNTHMWNPRYNTDNIDEVQCVRLYELCIAHKSLPHRL